MERYKYYLVDRNGVHETCEAESLDKAMVQFGLTDFKVMAEFSKMAFVENKHLQFGIRWETV